MHNSVARLLKARHFLACAGRYGTTFGFFLIKVKLSQPDVDLDTLVG